METKKPLQQILFELVDAFQHRHYYTDATVCKKKFEFEKCYQCENFQTCEPEVTFREKLDEIVKDLDNTGEISFEAAIEGGNVFETIDGYIAPDFEAVKVYFENMKSRCPQVENDSSNAWGITLYQRYANGSLSERDCIYINLTVAAEELNLIRKEPMFKRSIK